MKTKLTSNRTTIRFLNYFGFIFLFFILDSPNYSFGISGPYTHEVIQLKAYEGFAASKSVELNYACINMLTQFNYQADVLHMKNDSNHCDNSNFIGCSKGLHDLLEESFTSDSISGLRKIGMALHIAQDFYAHSNWVEIMESSTTLAPIEMMRNPAVVLLFPNLQSGLVGYIPIDLEDQFDCFFEKQEMWKYAVKGATHACMEKDSNKSERGGALSFGVPMKTYHELAGELAVKHSIKILDDLYRRKNPALLSCIVPKLGKTGCRHIVQRQLN